MKSRKLSPVFLLVTVPIHLLMIVSIYRYFTEDISLAHVVFAVVLWICIAGLGIAIGYHRLLSHGAFKAQNSIKRMLAFMGLFACQSSPVFWVAVHRGLHHPHSDTLKDPHTPLKGFFYSFLGWQFYFSANDFDIKYAIDIVRDPFLKFISLYYYQILWFVLGAVAIINLDFLFLALVPAMFISMHQENIVNCFCHAKGWGYRNFDIRDTSTNIWIFGFLFFGQGYHNNHHADPKNPVFSHKWYEVDITRPIIYLIKQKD